MPGESSIIRDPVHDEVQFTDSAIDRLLLRLINCREFQRLRRIKQLGFSEIVFPGANHSRLAHSIGVMNTARLFLNRIHALVGNDLTDEYRTIVLVGALLHDLGHGPFSHAFEKVTKDNHERRTHDIIMAPKTEVNQALRGFSNDLPSRVSSFFRASAEDDSPAAQIPTFLSHIVTSQLDADRSDYLLRDSHATGTEYGKFDLRWMIDHLMVDDKRRWLYLSRKGLLVGEQYVFARYHMYQAVYFHKATRAAEVMLRLLFRRYKALLSDATTPEAKKLVVPGAPLAVIGAFSGEISLADYLELDDHSMSEFFKCCERSRDRILADLASGILHRKLYKCLDFTGMQYPQVQEFVEAAKDLLHARGLVREYHLSDDTPADTPYKIYDPAEEQPATQIFIEDSSGKVRPINHVSDQVEALRKQITQLRYYFPATLREEMKALKRS